MGDKTGIEWTDATWNPTVGCSRVSPGCDNCYAMRLAPRLQGSHVAGYDGVVADGDWTGRINVAGGRLEQPLRWARPRRIFVDSMSDLFHPDVALATIAHVFAVMALAEQHTFQVLTKRPQRMATLLGTHEFRVAVDDHRERLRPGCGDFFWPLENVWLGTSIESDTYSWRADYLRGTAAEVRFISAEPLLGPLPSLDLTNIDWLIAGGESGPRSRPMHPDWVRDLRDRCMGSPGVGSTAFLFKQWGEWGPDIVVGDGPTPQVRFHAWHDETPDGIRLTQVYKLGKHASGRTLDGRTWNEYPA